MGIDLEEIPPLQKNRFERWCRLKRGRKRFLHLHWIVEPQGGVDSTLAGEELKWVDRRSTDKCRFRTRDADRRRAAEGDGVIYELEFGYGHRIIGFWGVGLKRECNRERLANNYRCSGCC